MKAIAVTLVNLPTPEELGAAFVLGFLFSVGLAWVFKGLFR